MRSVEHQNFCDEVAGSVKGIPLNADHSFDDRLAFATNAKAIEAAIQANRDILTELEETSSQITDKSIELIDDMGGVFKSKSEHVAALRSWRKVVEIEVREIEVSIKRITSALSKDKIEGLREFVSLVERLNKIEPNAVVKKMFND